MLGPGRGGVDCLGTCNGRTAVGLGAENTRLPGNTTFKHERNRIIRWGIFTRPRIKSLLVVLRLFAFTFCVLVCPGFVHADDAEKDRAYAQFVHEGDRARLVGRTPDALAAYEKALVLREEPRILGRLGLAYLDGQLPVKAASFLFRALIDISDVPQGERWAIKDAYDRARSAVSRIKIDVSHLGADVLVDGKRERSKTDANSFYFFITPGHHEFRATLAGYEDAVATIDVKKGETVPISFALKPSPKPEPPLLAPIAIEKRNGTTTANHNKSIVTKPSPWSVGAGVVALSGAISYVPATGLVAGVKYHYGEWLSFPLDGRVAWSPQYEATRPVRGITFGGTLGACANRSIYFACIVGYVGGIGHSLETQNNPEIVWRVRFGGGPVVGVVLPFYREFSVRVGAELMILQDGTQVLAGSNSNPFVVWEGPPVLGGFSFTLVWRPELRVLR